VKIRRDFELEFDREKYIQVHGESFARLMARPDIQAIFEEVLVEAKDIIRPAAVWESFPIEEFLHEKIVLGGGVKIGGGPVVAVLRGADNMIAAVCTLGSGIDRKLSYYQQVGEMLRAILLDELATWALDLVRLQLCLGLEKDLQARGLRTSAPLSPGESTWSIKDQRVIFDLLDASEIGVTLNDSLLMIPIKSLSLIMGSGSQPLGVEDASNCDFCSLKERCRYHKLRDEFHGVG
jgi:hypothetical protein